MADLSNRTIKFPRPLKRVTVTYCGKPSVPAQDAEERERIAYERGKADAHEAIAAQVEALREEMTNRQNALLQSLQEGQENAMAQLSQRVPQLVVRAAERVIESIEVEPKHVQAIVDKIIKEAPEDEKLRVRLHPEDLQLLRNLDAGGQGKESPDAAADSVDFAQALSGLFGGDDSGDALSARYPDIQFEADDSLNRGDCFVESRFGTLDGSVTTRLRSLGGANS